jgi:hypothetical protein
LQLPILPEIFHVWSLNRLMDMVGTLATRRIAAEPKVVGQKRWQDWEQLSGALRIQEEKLLVALGPQAKALLLWMQGGVGGRQTVAFQVGHPFQLTPEVLLLYTNVLLTPPPPSPSHFDSPPCVFQLVTCKSLPGAIWYWASTWIWDIFFGKHENANLYGLNVQDLETWHGLTGEKPFGVTASPCISYKFRCKSLPAGTPGDRIRPPG